MSISPSCVPCSRCNNTGLELNYEVINNVGYYHVSCSVKHDGCSNRGGSFDNQDVAIEEWNTQEKLRNSNNNPTKVIADEWNRKEKLRSSNNITKAIADKDRTDKPPLDLVPFSLSESAARAFAFGEKKYSKHNWRKGMPTSWIVRSLLSHMGKWNEGENCDTESGLSHLDHIAACTAMLIETVAKHPIVDDRFKPDGSTPPCIAMRGATQHQNQGATHDYV